MTQNFEESAEVAASRIDESLIDVVEVESHQHVEISQEQIDITGVELQLADCNCDITTHHVQPEIQSEVVEKVLEYNPEPQDNEIQKEESLEELPVQANYVPGTCSWLERLLKNIADQYKNRNRNSDTETISEINRNTNQNITEVGTLVLQGQELMDDGSLGPLEVGYSESIGKNYNSVLLKIPSTSEHHDAKITIMVGHDDTFSSSHVKKYVEKKSAEPKPQRVQKQKPHYMSLNELPQRNITWDAFRDLPYIERVKETLALVDMDRLVVKYTIKWMSENREIVKDFHNPYFYIVLCEIWDLLHDRLKNNYTEIMKKFFNLKNNINKDFVKKFKGNDFEPQFFIDREQMLLSVKDPDIGPIVKIINQTTKSMPKFTHVVKYIIDVLGSEAVEVIYTEGMHSPQPSRLPLNSES